MSVESSLLLFFLLCLTVYACNARGLSVMDRESSRQVQLPGQDMEEVIVDRTSIPLKVKLSMSKEVQTHGQALAGANTQKLKDMKTLPKRVEERRATISGINIIMHSSDDVGLRQATKIQGFKRRLRSLVGSACSACSTSKEMVDSKENDVYEDVVVMDYEQPHRKPPIHNSLP